MAAVGAIIGAAGSVMQGIAGQASAAYQAQVAKNNAKIAKWNERYAIQAGQREEEAYRMKASGVINAQKAVQSASGVDVNVGTPVSVRRGARAIEELDALTIRNNAARRAYDFRTQRMNFLAESELSEAAGRSALLEGILGGVSSLAGSASKFSSKWASWQSPVSYTPSELAVSSPAAPVSATRDFDYKMWA